MQALKSIFNGGSEVKFVKNQLIISPEVRGDFIYYLVSGFVFVYAQQKGSNRKIQLVLKKDEIFPLLWMFEGLDKELYFETLTDTTLIALSKDEFRDKINKNKKANSDLIKQLVTYLSIYVERLENLEYKNVEERLASRLAFFSNRFGKLNNNKIQITIPMTHQFIADSINVARENTTKQLIKLEKQKIIEIKKHYVNILDAKKLKSKFT